MKLTITALAAAALACPALSQQVLPAQSEIAFDSRQMGVPVEGKFGQWTAQIAFDPKRAAAGKVGFTIQTGSARFGSPETDAEMPKAPWFNVARLPTASFKSSSIKPLGGCRCEVAGTLSIKGHSQAVVVHVTLTRSGTNGTATGSFSIKPLDFGIGGGEWADTSMVADDVTAKFKLALSGLAPQ
jgi:polyisoprenoid-binding protein YceI